MSYASDEELLRRWKRLGINTGIYTNVDSSDLINALEERNQPKPAPPAPGQTGTAGSSINPSFLLAGLGAVAVVVTKKKRKK